MKLNSGRTSLLFLLLLSSAIAKAQTSANPAQAPQARGQPTTQGASQPTTLRTQQPAATSGNTSVRLPQTQPYTAAQPANPVRNAGAPATSTQTVPQTTRPAAVAPANRAAAPANTSPPAVSSQVPQTRAIPTAMKNGEEAVDLGTEFNTPVAKPLSQTSAPQSGKRQGYGFSAMGPPQGSGAPGITFGSPEAPINLKVYFDINLYSRPGISDLTFENYHSFLFVEAAPMPNMNFSFDVNPSPRFYEFDWQLTPSVQLRLGKIWIPFDDTTPHNIYGGRVNVSKLSLTVPNGVQFLPDLWTELGIGIKWIIRDVKYMNLVADFYAVNGFGGGGRDPSPTNRSTIYPSFGDSSSTASDTNKDKAFGARLHGFFWNRFGLGASVYSGRWSADADPGERLLITGFDAQYKIPNGPEFRAGIASMKVDLPTGPFYRAGTYAEVGQYLTRDHLWKLLIRGGTLQTDDRVLDPNDQRIVGATIMRRIGIVQLSLEHSNDIQKISGKNNYSFTNLRAVFAF